MDGVPLPKTDAGALTVVTTSAAYVDALQRERASGKRMVAGLEAVLKATGGEEMLDAWRAVSVFLSSLPTLLQQQTRLNAVQIM